MSYPNPIVEKKRIIFRSNRYVVIQLVGAESFDGWSQKECNFVCYDNLKTCVISLMKKLDGGKFECLGLGIYSTPKVFENMEDAMKWIPYESRLCELAFTGR